MPTTTNPSLHRAERQKGQPIFEILHKDHETVAGLFAAIEAATDDDDRQNLCQMLVRELKLHAHAEEDIFYDRLEREKAARRRMSESRDDHTDIDLQLDRLARLDGDDERLMQLVTDLKADVDRHVRHEEGEVFVAAEALFDPGEAQALGQAFLARKKQLASGPVVQASYGDDADLSDRSLAERPVSLQTSAPALDPGLEDRGVGSDGSSPQTAAVDPDASSPSKSASKSPSKSASKSAWPATTQNAGADRNGSEAGGPIEAADADKVSSIDSADIPSGPPQPTLPAVASDQPQMDQGLEDRGVGSPSPAPTKPLLPLKPHDPEKQAAKHEKKSHPKPQSQAPDVGSKVQGAPGYLPGAPPRGFEGTNSGGRNGERSQRENHLSRDKQVPRVHDGRGKPGPENDR